MSKVTFAHTKEGHHPVKIDVPRLIETRLILQANSGGGKSYALRKVLEVTHGKVQHIILDTEGEFNSLREKLDYVYIEKNEKISPDATTAAQLATMLLELETSAIIDLYELHPRERKHFIRIFLDALIGAPKRLWHPVLVVLDEAHEYAPESERSESLEPVVLLQSKGRKREFCGALATQRFAKLSKDAAAELQNKVFGLGNFDIDRARAGDELGFNKADRLVLRDLDAGEFFVTGPAFFVGDERIKEPVLVKIDEVETPHGSQAKRWRAPKTAEAGEIKKALDALAALPKRAEEEAKTIEALQKQLRETKRELAQAKRGVPKTDTALLEKVKLQAKREVSQEVVKLMNKLGQLKNRLQARFKEIGILIDAIPDDVTQNKNVTENGVAEIASTKLLDTKGNVEYIQHHRKPAPALETEDGELKLGPTERAVLGFLASREGKLFSRVQIGVQTKYSRRSSTFQNAFPKLVRAGLISQDHSGNYGVFGEQADQISKLLGESFTSPADDRPEDWLPKLPPTPRVIFATILERKHQALTREDLSNLTKYSLNSSTFQNAFPELEKLGLIKKVGRAYQFNTESFSG